MGLRVVEVFDGGVDPEAPAVVRHLIRRGVDVHVVCPTPAAPSFTDVPVTALSVGTGVTTLAALRRVLSDGVDAIHAYGLRAGLAAALARSAGTPLVLSWSEPVATAGAAWLVGRALTRTVVPAARLVLAATPELADAAHRLGAPDVLLVAPVLPPPVEPPRTPAQVREELALPDDAPIVLARARLHEETRLDLLIEASVGWRRAGPGHGPTPQVVIIGVGPAYRQLVARATTARAPVTFAGERDGVAGTPVVAGTDGGAGTDVTAGTGGADADDEERAGLADLVAAASVAVVTDLRANPEFALWAVRAGVPVVAPAGGLVAELLGPGVVTVPTSDAAALEEAVRRLLDQPVDRIYPVAAARRRVQDWPNAAQAALELADLYAWVKRVTPDAG